MRKYPSDISVSKNCIDPNFKWSERRDPDNFPCFLPQEWCAWELPEIVLTSVRNDFTVNLVNANFRFSLNLVCLIQKFGINFWGQYIKIEALT